MPHPDVTSMHLCMYKREKREEKNSASAIGVIHNSIVSLQICKKKMPSIQIVILDIAKEIKQNSDNGDTLFRASLAN